MHVWVRGGVAGIDSGEDGEKVLVGCVVLGRGRERGTGSNGEFLVGRFGGEQGEEGDGRVYGVFVDVLGRSQ